MKRTDGVFVCVCEAGGVMAVGAVAVISRAIYEHLASVMLM